MSARARTQKAAKRPATDEGVVPLAFGCCALVLAYCVLRALQTKLFAQPDPRLVLVTEHVAFFWNLALSAYVAAMAVAGVLAARRVFGAPRVDRLLAPLVAVTAVVGVAHALLSP